MRIGIIGCGHAGRRHADQLSKMPEVELVACCDANDQVAARFGDDFKIRAYSDVSAMLARPLDGVTICTPPTSHARIAAAALARGLHVLCEKPLATDSDDCLTIPRSDLLMCAFKFRHLSGAAILREMVAAGELGRITHVRGTACSDADMTGRWFSDPMLSGGGVLLDNGVHIVDLCQFIVSPVEEICATLGAGTRGLDVEETASLDMRLTCGASANIHVSWEAPAPMGPLLEVYGTGGYARLGYEMQAFDAQRKLCRHAAAEGVDIWREVIANFVGFIAGRSAPSAIFDDGFSAVAVCEAAYRSVASQKWERPKCLAPVSK